MTEESIWSQGEFQPLTEEQITQLAEQGCNSGDWSKVLVANGFNAKAVKSTHFSGDIRLGVFEKQVSFPGGVEKPSGISNATIHNCIIGNNVYISRVGSYIANYIIEDDAIIDNIKLLTVDGESSFGNGTEVAVVNEAGGREIPIFDRLSSHMAYVIAFYRHKPEVIKKLQEMIESYRRSVTSSMGLVGKGAALTNCRIIKNVKFGPESIIEGATKLENGSVNSCREDPVYIGPAVLAENFITCSGSKITDGVIIEKCFIGQGTILSKQYSAENSVFFANCAGLHGEACAVFAGPYTVTHHKSTLLIAGLFSFFNAGSGTNQSNHMYKLGPVHQGIIERGSKTGSDSHMLWPVKVGAFTVVTGKHHSNPDTSDMPFSYLTEHENESILAPGVNLRSVGTVRDSQKWPNRDGRKSPEKLDLINTRLLSPYTAQKMLNGLDLLKNLKNTSENSDYFIYNNVKITKTALERGVKLYDIGIHKFLGNCLINLLENKNINNVEDLISALQPETEHGQGKWVDLSGLFAPDTIVQKTLCDIENGTIKTLEQVSEAFKAMHDNYPVYEWAWAADVMQQILGKKIKEIEPGDIIEFITGWKNAVVDLDHELYEDARKELSSTAQIGFGLDGDEMTKESDFAEVRGTFEHDSFVTEIEKHISSKTELAESLIKRMEALL